MSREAVATALDEAAEALARAAHALRGTEQPAAGGATVSPPPSPAPAAPRTGEHPSCPKHGKPFTPSKNPEWPSYCRETTDDPAWGKPKNDRDGNPVMYCRITSRNAGEYLAVHKAAPQMDSEEGLPF